MPFASDFVVDVCNGVQCMTYMCHVMPKDSSVMHDVGNKTLT